jgi:hypothetical protein
MRRGRFTIAQWMGLTAVLAVNGALVRAFFQGMFEGGILIFIALHAGLWCLFHSGGRAYSFWLGFEVLGALAVLAMFACEVFPDSLLNRLLMSYTDIAANLAFSHLPTPLVDYIDEQQGRLFAVVYFAPELVAALLGGMIAAGGPHGPGRPAGNKRPAPHSCPYQPDAPVGDRRCHALASASLPRLRVLVLRCLALAPHGPQRDRPPPPLWGRIKVGGRSPRYGACAACSARPCAGSPPTLTLPHNGGRETATTSAGVHALCKIILSTPGPELYVAAPSERANSATPKLARRVSLGLASGKGLEWSSGRILRNGIVQRS